MIRPLLLALALATPAAADRSVSLTWEPRNAREAQAFQLALGLYALSREIRGSGEIRQTGQGNAAVLIQQGGSFGIIRQQGDGHQAVFDQRAQGQAYAIIQRGTGTQAQVVQTRPGATGLTLQYGW